MIKLCLLIALSCVFVGCASRTAEWKNDPANDGMMCNHTVAPLDTGNGKVISELSLKRDLASGSQIIKATLAFIIMDFRDYSVESNEKLSMTVDGKESGIEILFSDKKAFEHFGSMYGAMPNGGSFKLGTVQERTRKTITFKLTVDQLNSLLKAKEAHFTISSSDDASRYVATITSLNINQIQSFKSVCYNQKGTK